jgi:protein-S-isoprenylcysteine O-methyltransferase Ste14
MKKLNFMGIGPKVGIVVLPWLAIAIFFSMKFRSSFTFIEDVNKILFLVGLVLLIIGSVMYLLTIPSLLNGLKNTKLITTGTFYLCCNPLYGSIILLIIPGVSFMMNSWLVLTTSLIGIILCKIFIKSEYAEMEKFFGDEFIRYKDKTPEFLPFPVKKIFRYI